MGQQMQSLNCKKKQTPQSLFQPIQNDKYDQRLQQAFRISNYEHELQNNHKKQCEQYQQHKKQQKSSKLQQPSFYDIISDPSTVVLKQKISLLHTDKQHPQCYLNNKTLLEDCLQKQAPTVFANWEKRYCLLQHHRFIYKSSHKFDSEDAGILNFNLLACQLTVSRKNKQIEYFAECSIQIEKCEKKFVFRHEDQEKMVIWVNKLEQITQQSLGRKYNLTYLTKYNRFWRKDYLSQQQFRQSSETGDLILMRGKSNSSALQRAITQQQFDHVALVLKNMKHQVLLFEATGGVGVGIVPWKRYVTKNWYQNQQIVVYRKLNIKRTQQFNKQIQEFVERNMGRKYKFSVKKYFMNRASEDNQDKKSYFCSSLIAKIYKDLEVLDDKLSSTQYLPSSYSEKQNLVLKKNGKYGDAFLERQKIIVFEKLFFQTKK